MDIFSKEKRSEIMKKVRSNGTDIEQILWQIAKPIWKKYRYRKNLKSLPGKPDLVFPIKQVAIFVDGDYWHGKNFKNWKHKIPKFWYEKILNNIKRDIAQNKELSKRGYAIARFWGSYIKKHPERVYKKIIKTLEAR